MNMRGETFKKEEPVWITLDDWIWSITDWMMFEEQIRRLLLEEQALPVIPY